MIELHDHVGAEIPLDPHHTLWREEMQRAVEMASKLHAILAHRPQPLEREHLKAARVRENRTAPAHEAVQPSEIANQLVAGTQMEMIRVRENHLRADLSQIVRVERLHRRERADRHERRRFDDTVRRREAPRTPAAALGVYREFE